MDGWMETASFPIHLWSSTKGFRSNKSNPFRHLTLTLLDKINYNVNSISILQIDITLNKNLRRMYGHPENIMAPPLFLYTIFKAAVCTILEFHVYKLTQNSSETSDYRVFHSWFNNQGFFFFLNIYFLKNRNACFLIMFELFLVMS